MAVREAQALEQVQKLAHETLVAVRATAAALAAAEAAVDAVERAKGRPEDPVGGLSSASVSGGAGQLAWMEAAPVTNRLPEFALCVGQVCSLSVKIVSKRRSISRALFRAAG